MAALTLFVLLPAALVAWWVRGERSGVAPNAKVRQHERRRKGGIPDPYHPRHSFSWALGAYVPRGQLWHSWG